MQYLSNNYNYFLPYNNIMTRVNLVLPFFETSLQTNNSEIITEIITQRYGFSVNNVYWIETPNSNTPFFECVVRVKDFSLNADNIAQLIEKTKSAEQTLKRLKNDIFKVVAKYNQLQNAKKEGHFEKLKEYANNFNQDSEVSLKIEQRSKGNQPRSKQYEYTQTQLITAISELTRQNLKLKDAIVYYEAQFSLFMKSQQQTKKQIK